MNFNSKNNIFTLITYKASRIYVSSFNTSFLTITFSCHFITKFSQIITKPENLNNLFDIKRVAIDVYSLVNTCELMEH